MNEPISLRVYEIVGNEFCVASDDGQKVFDQIAKALREDKKIKLSFANIESLTSAFLNTAIGQLYGSFQNDQIKNNLEISDMEQDDMMLLKRVVDTAKEYFKDPDRFEKLNKEAMEDSDVS
ncbi:TPA: DUF4325 domain-containing protein [bacterium]|jgi:hypothetical protein|nr:DUF4325 domain-containing protein [bacterium]